MIIYYKIEDGKVTDIYEPVEAGSEEQEKLTEYLADMCDDRVNYGKFEGFKGKNHYFMAKICRAYLKYLEKIGMGEE